MRRLRSSLGAWAPFLLASAVHLAGQVGRETGSATGDAVASGSKTLLMPALVVALLRLAGTPRSVWWPTAVAALFFSWLGDLALLGSGDAWFLAGVAMFGVAQGCYIATFVRAGGRSPSLAVLLPYAVWWLGLVGYFAATTGITPVMGAVAGYGLALGGMAFLAHRVNPLTALGAASFLVSDSLIAMRGFTDLRLPAHGVWVMVTYLAGQGAIVAGLLRQERAIRSTG